MKVLTEYVREEFKKRSSIDRRKKVNRLLVTYKDEYGMEYRKAYEYPVTTSYDEMVNLTPKTIK